MKYLKSCSLASSSSLSSASFILLSVVPTLFLVAVVAVLVLVSVCRVGHAASTSNALSSPCNSSDANSSAYRSCATAANLPKEHWFGLLSFVFAIFWCACFGFKFPENIVRCPRPETNKRPRQKAHACPLQRDIILWQELLFDVGTTNGTVRSSISVLLGKSTILSHVCGDITAVVAVFDVRSLGAVSNPSPSAGFLEQGLH